MASRGWPSLTRVTGGAAGLADGGAAGATDIVRTRKLSRTELKLALQLHIALSFMRFILVSFVSSIKSNWAKIRRTTASTDQTRWLSGGAPATSNPVPRETPSSVD